MADFHYPAGRLRPHRIGAATPGKPAKLIIQIPCFNEEETIAATLADLPRTLPGIPIIEWLIVDDGSTDRTVEVARAAGADHIVHLTTHSGLARAFMAGLEAAVRLGADIVVNTDADNQYRGADVALLVRPILDRQAEFVVGDRPISSIESFSRTKRTLQRLGSRVARLLSDTKVRDAPSGFRALSRDAALHMNLFGSYTYTLESLIQAGRSNMRVVSVPISVNPVTRRSRLVRSIGDYLRRSIGAMLLAFFIYKPAKTFLLIGSIPALAGTILILRWLFLTAEDIGGTHVPSLLAAAVLLILAFLLWMLGLLGKLFAINRSLLQEVQYMLRRAHADASEIIRADAEQEKSGSS